MSEISEKAKKVAALGTAGVVAAAGATIVAHKQNDKKIENLETATSATQEYIGEIPSQNAEFSLGSTTYIFTEPTAGIFGNVIEKNEPTTEIRFEPEIETTKYKLDEDRIVAPSKFADLNELYIHYEQVWKEKNQGKTPLEVIKSVDTDEVNNDDELKIAASLMFLSKGNTKEEKTIIQKLLPNQTKDIQTIYEENAYYMQLLQVLCLIGSDHLDSRIMAELEPFWAQFPKEFLEIENNYFSAVKCYIHLANEFTALIDVKEKGIVAITYGAAYMTPEVARIAEQYGIRLNSDVLENLAVLNDGKSRGLKR